MNTADLLDKFYRSFSQGNAQGMVDCYHKEITFQDPAFGTLLGERAGYMWKMLLGRNSGLKIGYEILQTSDFYGKVKWMATYKYGPQKRDVTNEVLAEFKIKDGKIIEHIDNFDLWKWSGQALGFSGYLLGWSSFMKKGIQKKTNEMLTQFIEERVASNAKAIK